VGIYLISEALTTTDKFTDHMRSKVNLL